MIDYCQTMIDYYGGVPLDLNEFATKLVRCRTQLQLSVAEVADGTGIATNRLEGFEGASAATPNRQTRKRFATRQKISDVATRLFTEKRSLEFHPDKWPTLPPRAFVPA